MAGPERRRHILAGAKRVFAQRGYHQTHIRHICDDLGIGRGTLYQYFENKQDVFVAIIEDLLERLRAAVQERPKLEIPEDVPLDQALAGSSLRLRKVLEVVFEDEASLRILLREAVGLDLRVDQIVAAVDAIVIDAVAGDVAEAQRARLVRDDIDPHDVALLIVGGVQKLALAALADDSPIDLDAMTTKITNVHWMGIAHPEVKR